MRITNTGPRPIAIGRGREQAKSKKIFENQNLKISPNPFSFDCTIEINDNVIKFPINLSIFGYVGKLVSLQIISEQSSKLVISGQKFNSGIYTVVINDGLNSPLTGKICLIK